MTEPARVTEPPAAAPGPRPVAPASGVAPLPPSARELRRARARKLILRYAIFVGIPTLLAVLYYGVLASRQYDATTVVSIESNDPAAATPAKGGNTPHQRDARLLGEHILSRAMLARLDAELHLMAHYQDPDVDWWSRLADDAGKDGTFDYYRSKVSAKVDPQSSALALRVRAFSPERAEELLGAIVAASQTWVEELSARARREQLEPAEAEVSAARQRLVAARIATLAVTGGAPPTPEQLADPVVVEHELAELTMTDAIEGLQHARLAAANGQRYLLVIDAPSLPDQASRPRPVWDIATVLITALVLVSVLSLLGAAVREHANF